MSAAGKGVRCRFSRMVENIRAASSWLYGTQRCPWRPMDCPCPLCTGGAIVGDGSGGHAVEDALTVMSVHQSCQRRVFHPGNNAMLEQYSRLPQCRPVH